LPGHTRQATPLVAPPRRRGPDSYAVGATHNPHLKTPLVVARSVATKQTLFEEDAHAQTSTHEQGAPVPPSSHSANSRHCEQRRKAKVGKVKAACPPLCGNLPFPLSCPRRQDMAQPPSAPQPLPPGGSRRSPRRICPEMLLAMTAVTEIKEGGHKPRPYIGTLPVKELLALRVIIAPNSGTDSRRQTRRLASEGRRRSLSYVEVRAPPATRYAGDWRSRPR